MKYPIITIEREYASGGRAVGQQAAKLLGVPCCGSEVLRQAAARLGRPADYVEHLDDKAACDLVLDSGTLGIPLCAELLARAAKG